ncbi:cell envelope integrity protein TolA [Opitutus terrae]|uniref:cell envelope integrity protein TolA n=1 Tax=Opitutus terrae TaxID=107709 RepID=UPI00031929FE|nr:cell envelope integrity protein TolA [Opitutus terrae]
MLSATLHGVLAALVLYFTYGLSDRMKENPTIFELVAGEGDNYMATEAPALGTPSGIKLAIPELPPAKAAPEPVLAPPPPPEPVIQRAPERKAPVVAKATPAPEEVKIRDFSKDVTRISNKRQARLEAAEKKRREAAERKAKEEALKSQRMTKADFDRQNKSKPSPSAKGGSSVKVARIDAQGIAKGVIGGSTANKVGGAGGTALTRAEGDAIDAYTALLARKIKTELDEKPGVGAGLIVEVEVRILADGTLTGFRIIDSSGSQEFDQAVREAFATMQMPPRPKGLSELQRFPIRGVE